LLAHSQYRLLPVIQISDFTGAYGVSFLLAVFNGAIADAIFCSVGRPADERFAGRCRRRMVACGAAALGCLAATLVYGWYRLSADTMSEGPRIALLQRDYPNYTDLEKLRREPGPVQKLRDYFEMMSQALPEKPDLFLFPETAWGWMHLNREFIHASPDQIKNDAFRSVQPWSRKCYEMLREWAVRTGTSVVIGSMSVTPTPLSLRATEMLHNSVFHFKPDGSELERHDKTHPVLFGETIPFRFGRLRFLYFWFNRLSPFGSGGFEYSLFPGTRAEVFTMTAGNGRAYRFGVPICYEDVMPYVCRRFVWDADRREKRVDFLCNISNDGWFLHGTELPQHFAICTFRAVENRVGIARTVNTGISGFIRPDGGSHDKIGVGEVGFRVAAVTLDDRVSLYSRYGDVFAVACAVLACLMCLDHVVVRVVETRRRKMGAKAARAAGAS